MPRAELDSDPGPITVVRWNAEGTRCPCCAVEGTQARRAGNCKPVEPPGDVKIRPVFILD